MSGLKKSICIFICICICIALQGTRVKSMSGMKKSQGARAKGRLLKLPSEWWDEGKQGWIYIFYLYFHFCLYFILYLNLARQLPAEWCQARWKETGGEKLKHIVVAALQDVGRSQKKLEEVGRINQLGACLCDRLGDDKLKSQKFTECLGWFPCINIPAHSIAL